MTFSIEKMFMIVMFIIIIFLVYKINKLSTSIQENMTPSDSSLMLNTINNEINRIYNMDTEAIRNLGAISKSLLTGTNYHSTTVGTPGDLTIPANNTYFPGSVDCHGNLHVYGNISSEGWDQDFLHHVRIGDKLTLPGGVYFDGNGHFKSKDLTIWNNGSITIANGKVLFHEDGSHNLPIIGSQNQKWVNMTAKRSNNTLYTNLTDLPIQVQISVHVDCGKSQGIGTLQPIQFYVNNVLIQFSGGGGNAYEVYQNFASIVPKDATYKITFDTAWSRLSIVNWSELTTA